MSSVSKAKANGSIIGMNPTGTLSISPNNSNSLHMNGSNNTINNPASASKSSLEKVQNNQVNCSGVENFENQIINNELFYKNYSYNNKKILFLIILIFLFLIFFIFL